MALTAKLYFGSNEKNQQERDSGSGNSQHDKEYLLADCRFVFERSHNDFRPENYARCERIEVVLPAPTKQDMTMYQWYYNMESKEGWIEIAMTDNGQTAGDDEQIIRFIGGKCISLSEHYDISTMKQRQIKVCFTAEELKFDDINFNLYKL